MNLNLFLKLFIIFLPIYACGKVGPLTLPEDKLDKTIITYPCDEDCQEKFEEEKKRQQSIVIQTD